MVDDNEKTRQLLEALREELLGLIAGSSESTAPVPLEQDTLGRIARMDLMQGQAMAQAAERARKRDLVRIEMALRRVTEGRYGECVECGEFIASRRLGIDPMAERCISCAGRA